MAHSVHSYLFKLIDFLRINCNFYYEIVQNKWFKMVYMSNLNINELPLKPLNITNSELRIFKMKL